MCVVLCCVVCVFVHGRQMDHFLIQDSELFCCELEAKPEAYLSAGITVPVRGHLFLLLFPYSSFPPSLPLGKDWDPHVNCAHLLLLADVHWRLRFCCCQHLMSPTEPPLFFWDSHITAGGSAESRSWTRREWRRVLAQLLQPWAGIWDVFISKAASCKWWWDFKALYT